MMKSKEDKLKIVLSSILICGIFYIIEQYTTLPYLFTTLGKIILFGGTSCALYYLYNNRSPKELILSETGIKNVKFGIVIGLLVLIVVWIGYFIFRSMIDLDLIMEELLTSSAITKYNYPLVALYITFGNSFLEEIFFRGFIFLQLYSKGYKNLAYIFSSGLFAIYHIAIFKTWFNPIIILIALVGLFVGGIIFNYINTKTKSILNSWLVHIFADIAIVAIGFTMFYL